MTRDDEDDQSNIEEETNALNEGDRTFLERIKWNDDEDMEDDTRVDDDEDEGDDNAEDDEAEKDDDQRLWQQVLDLHEGDTGRGLLIGPLTQHHRHTGTSTVVTNTANACGTAAAAMMTGPSLLGAGGTTIQELADLAALTADMESQPPLHNDTLGVSRNNSAATTNMHAVAGIPEMTTSPEIFTYGNTPPRKRKFDILMNRNSRNQGGGTVDNLMLNFKPPPRNSIERHNHNNTNMPMASTLHQFRPRPDLMHTQQLPRELNFVAGSGRIHGPDGRHLGEDLNVVQHSVRDADRDPLLRNYPQQPQQQQQQRVQQEQQKQQHSRPHSSDRQRPRSLARTRWEFVISERTKIEKTLEAAKEDFERAQNNLKEAQQSYKCVQEAVQKTCRQYFSFLIREDESWYEGYQLLLSYKDKFGDTRVPRSMQSIKKKSKKNEDDQAIITTKLKDGDQPDNSKEISDFSNLSKLSRWTATQRKLHRKGELDEYKVYALEQVDFDFDPVESRWKAMYQALLDFVKEHGHAKVPYNYGFVGPNDEKKRKKMENKGKDPGDLSLGSWVKRNQYQYKRFIDGKTSEMTQERVDLLTKAGFIFNRREEAWMERLKEIQDYKKKWGHCNVKPTENAPLAEWIRDQRSRYNEYKNSPDRSSLSQRQVQLIEEVGLDVTDKRESKWQLRIDELLDFRCRHGHCRVPNNYPNNQSLSSWCKRQRQNYRQHIQGQETPLTPDRINQLERIGFEFEVSSDGKKELEMAKKSWEECFAEVSKFREEKGHTEIPESTELGEWWKIQKLSWKARKQCRGEEETDESLSEEQFEQLTSILSPSKATPNGQNVISTSSKSWEECFTELVLHRIHAKTFRIPQSRLGLSHWVEEQRNEYGKYAMGLPSKLTLCQISKLQSIKFPFNLKSRTGSSRKPKMKKTWEEMYTELLQHRLVTDSFHVPKEANCELHSWAQQQHKLYKDYSRGTAKDVYVTQRINKLRTAGFPFHSTAPINLANEHSVATIQNNERVILHQQTTNDSVAPPEQHQTHMDWTNHQHLDSALETAMANEEDLDQNDEL